MRSSVGIHLRGLQALVAEQIPNLNDAESLLEAFGSEAVP